MNWFFFLEKEIHAFGMNCHKKMPNYPIKDTMRPIGEMPTVAI
jgi:hypothetical protein